jgi:hypothetical protein
MSENQQTDLPPLWQCPRCGEKFTSANQWHSCGKYSLEALFAICDPQVFGIYQQFARMVEACGPVTIIPQKTRVTFQARIRFVSLYPRKTHLVGGFVFARRHDHPRFYKIESLSPRNHLHHFRLESQEELDEEFREWIAEAYAVGKQEHLTHKETH